MSESEPISSDPRATEMLAKSLRYDRDGLVHIIKLLAERPDRGYTSSEVVLWLTNPNEALGWKWPLWCTREQVEQVITTGERVIG